MPKERFIPFLLNLNKKYIGIVIRVAKMADLDDNRQIEIKKTIIEEIQKTFNFQFVSFEKSDSNAINNEKRTYIAR